MKAKHLLTAAALGMALGAQATIHQVDNNNNSPGVFTTIQAANDAAAPNDTLYIHASPTTYNGANITKPLVIIGEGALPNKNFQFRSQVNSLDFTYSSNGLSNGSGSRVYGLYITSYIQFFSNSAGTAAVGNIIVSRCRVGQVYFYGGSTYGPFGITLTNNIIDLIQGAPRLSGISIRNNIINQVSSVGNDNANTSWTLRNNIIFSSMGNCNRGTITDNIFFGNGSFGNNAYCTITHNAFVNTQGTTVTEANIIYGTNTGANNLLNVDPLFIQPEGNVYSYSYTTPAEGAPTLNYNLQASSPCIGTGTEGGTMGIYGGINPFVEGTPANSRYRYFPMPFVPAVLDMNVLNGSVAPGGTLNIQFTGRKQD